MKTFFGAAVIGVILIAGGIFFDICIKDFSNEMLLRCEKLEDNLSVGEGEGAEIIEEYLEGRKILLASIINHDSIDDIETCMAEMREYINQWNFKEASVRCEKLMLLLERLPIEYGVSLQNIL